MIANVKNIDAVDVSATNISCDTLSVAGEPISNIWQNVTNTSVGFTQFTGNVEITDILDVSTRIVTPTLQSQTVTTGTLSATSMSNTGSLTVSGASALQALSTTSLTCTGDMTVDTTTLKVDSANNKVGINTTAAPSEALDVVGNIKGSGTLTVAGNMTVDTSTLVVNASSNRVGVNVATPSEALDVSGNIKGSGTLAITGNGTVGGTLGVTGDLTVDTDALKVIASTNRVGINTTAPTDTLDVNGTTSLRGNTIVGSAALKVSTTDNRVGVNTLNPTETLDVTGNIKGSGTLAITGNATIGGTLTANGRSVVTTASGQNSLFTTGTVNSLEITLGSNCTRITLMGITAAATHNIYLNIPVACSGETYGTNAALIETWAANTAYIKNATLSIPSGSKAYGWIDIQRITATTSMITSYVIWSGANNYTATMCGLITAATSTVTLMCNTNISAGGRVCTSYF